jgi:hypothetical protein
MLNMNIYILFSLYKHFVYEQFYLNADNDNFDNKGAANYHRKTPLRTRMEPTLFNILILGEETLLQPTDHT